jgi:hypothetical protein
MTSAPTSRNTLLLYARKRVDEALAPLTAPGADHVTIHHAEQALEPLRLHFARHHITLGPLRAEGGEFVVDIGETLR